MAIPKAHPYWCVRSVVDHHKDGIRHLHFSYYEYRPQSLIDTREVFRVSASDFIEEGFVSGVIANVPVGRELAFHSLVETGAGMQKHIPMVDMSTGSVAQLRKLEPFLGEKRFRSFKWYRSGRSYHGYGYDLISNDEWAALMGALLLANQSGLPPTVDPRWVGHRLIAGYAALRWTKNTDHYIELPKEVV